MGNFSEYYPSRPQNFASATPNTSADTDKTHVKLSC